MCKIIRNAILEILFPTECILCKAPGNFLCGDCAGLLDVSPVHHPDRTTKYLDDAYAACAYENRFAKKIIARLKYDPFHKSLAAPVAEAIAGHFRLAEENVNRQAIISAVPLAAKRLRWRGFNQAQMIAQELGKIWRLPVCNSCLARTRDTKNQAELTGPKRRENIKGAFVCPDNSLIKNKIVYLVDDVMTTGATLNECAKILKLHGAAKVNGIAFARAKD
jgi:ComF family protein